MPLSFDLHAADNENIKKLVAFNDVLYGLLWKSTVLKPHASCTAFQNFYDIATKICDDGPRSS